MKELNVNHYSMKPITLTHHVFHDNLGWRKQASSDSDSKSGQDWLLPVWNTTMNSPTWRANDCTCDIRHKSYLISLKAIYRLGFNRSDLIPVKHRMSAINRDTINIIGAIFLQLSGIDKGGFPLETARSVMLCDFPRIGEAHECSYHSWDECFSWLIRKVLQLTHKKSALAANNKPHATQDNPNLEIQECDCPTTPPLPSPPPPQEGEPTTHPNYGTLSNHRG